MAVAIGVVMTEHIVAGRLEDHTLVGGAVRYPKDNPEDDQAEHEKTESDALITLPGSELAEIVAGQIAELAGNGKPIQAIGVAVPGIVRHGVIEESPNFVQLKGMRLAEELGKILVARGIDAPVHVGNDADAIAAGVAATRGQLDRLTRVWTIGNGVGYGRWPYVDGVWEGGHITVTLDPKERFCGCGGVGHMEGIVGYRAMRLRFLDREPEEVFAAARQGDKSSREFVDLWHRALAAGTASFIHLAGPGRFYFTGHHVEFVDLPLLRAHLDSMVKMSPLQSFSLEVLEENDETALLGAGVSALRALTW